MKRYSRPGPLFPSGYTFALVAICVVGSVLRLYGLESESLWWDEVYAIGEMARPGPLEIIRLSTSDNNPPLFYLILHYWILLAGNSEFAVRLPSAVAGALAVWALYRIGALLFDRNAGLLAALILALSAYHVRYAQEARAYGLMVCLTLLSFYFFLKLAKGDGSPRYAGGGYVICTALLMYTHFFAVFFVAAQVIFLLAARESLRRWIFPAAALGLLCVPWVVLLAINVLSPAGAWQSGTTWIPEPTLADMIEILHAYSGSLPLTIVFTSLFAYGLARTIVVQRPVAYVLLAWLLVPIVAPLLVSHLYRPILADRYTIAASPAFYLLAAQGLEGLKGFAYRGKRYAQALMVAIIAALAVVSIVGYFEEVTKQPWREVAGYVDEHGRAGDLVLFYWGGGALPFDYYSERPDIDTEAFLVEDNASIRKTTSTTVRGRDRVWLVMIWDSGRVKTVLPQRLARLYGEATYQRDYAVTDPYNSEVATIPYQGDGIDLLLFEGPERVKEN